MPILTLFAFIFLGTAFLSLWIRRDPKIWGLLFALSMLSGLLAGNIDLIGLTFILTLMFLWIFYDRNPHIALFTAIICLSVCFKLRFIPGYHPFYLTPKFALGVEGPLIGLFPLALLVPLAKSVQDWKVVFKGLAIGCAGIVVVAALATLSGATHLHYKMPTFMVTRTLSNLILTSIPEEGFYRGFVQKTLCNYFNNTRRGNIIALLLTSLLFTATHIFWSPSLGVLAFTFVASLLYGTVYLISGKIESAILCHFLLNLIHMTFFSYHGM